MQFFSKSDFPRSTAPHGGVQQDHEQLCSYGRESELATNLSRRKKLVENTWKDQGRRWYGNSLGYTELYNPGKRFHGTQK